MALDVTEVKVRAAVRMGGADGFYLETPYVKTFNVQRTRGQMSASFSATLKVKHSQLADNKTSMVGNLFEIWAGTININQAATQEQQLPNIFTKNGSRYLMGLDGDPDAGIRKVFTGYVLKMTFNPCRDDAEFIFLNVSGQDGFWALENKKFSRRVKASNMEVWGAITGVVRNRANFDSKFPAKVIDEEPVVDDKVMFKRSIVKTLLATTQPTVPKEDAGKFIVTSVPSSEGATEETEE